MENSPGQTPFPEEAQQQFAPLPPHPAQQSSPVLLIVMCVLTLIGSLFAIGSNLFSFFTYSRISSIDSEYLSDLSSTYRIIMLMTIPSMLMAVGRIVGASIMLGRRKAGLYVYTISEVIAVVIGLVTQVLTITMFMDGSSLLSGPSFGSGIGMGMVYSLGGLVVSLLFSVLFLIGYWTQRKHLR